jgi:uncharacterized 2Fe-2S/4Fe-4S cluster protein (DUF4445 family)
MNRDESTCDHQCHRCGRCFIDHRTILTQSTLLVDFEKLPVREGLGVAVDLGTSTVVAYLWDFSNKQVAKVASKINSQRRHGIDVITRQQAALSGKQQLLHAAAIQDVNELILDLTTELEDIRIISLVGNTTMRDFFFDMPPTWAVTPPYDTDYKDPIILDATAVNLIAKNAEIYSPPVVHGYWGSDALVGAYVLRLSQDPFTLFLDLGTNGEIALSDPTPSGRGNTILATSVSSAPCFEGMQIRCGMGARPGAIAHITLVQDLSPKFEIISDDPGFEQTPRGICGSGVIDLVAELLHHNVITSSGVFTPHLKHPRIVQTPHGKAFQFHSSPNLFITQRDIGEVLMAKASFSAAIRTLMEEMTPFLHTTIEKIYLAGAFGLHSAPKNAVRMGLIPLCSKIEAVGNTAGLGALHYLYEEERKHIDALVNDILYFPLTGNEQFNTHFLMENVFPASLSISDAQSAI